MLLGNYTALNKSAGRSLSGSTVSDTRAQWRSSGAARGRFYGVEGLGHDKRSATPNGYLPPYSWVLPYTAGGIASNTLLTGSGSITAGAAGGVAIEADLSGVGTLTAPLSALTFMVATLTGSGVISDAQGAAYLNAMEAALSGSGTISDADGVALLNAMVATLTGSGSLSGNAVALVNAVATLSGSSSMSVLGGAIANIIAALAGSGAVTGTPRADGELVADLTPFTELSPESLAAAVWNSDTAGYDESTFGYATAFLYHLAHHKIITDPVAGTFTVYDTDGTTAVSYTHLTLPTICSG